MSARIYLFLTTCCIVFALSASSANALEPSVAEAKNPAITETGVSDKASPAVVQESREAPKTTTPEPDAVTPAGESTVADKEEKPPSTSTGNVAAKPAAESEVQKSSPASDNPVSSSPAPGTEGDTNAPDGPNVRIITETNPAPPDTGPPEYHKAQFRLSGSMCYSCLNTLKRKLLQVYGVQVMRVDKPVHNLFQPYAPDVSSWAEAVLVYDQRKVALSDVRAFMRSQGYMSYKVIDKVFTDSLDSIKAPQERR